MHPGPVPARQSVLPFRPPEAEGPFAGSTLTCTGTPYASDPCDCIYHVLTRAFTPPEPDRVLPFKPPRSFSKKRIFQQTKKPNQSEQLWT